LSSVITFYGGTYHKDETNGNNERTHRVRCEAHVEIRADEIETP
jgi:hypothetical protein